MIDALWKQHFMMSKTTTLQTMKETFSYNVQVQDPKTLFVHRC